MRASLAPGMVPPDDLRFHIRSAVEVAHAERIGHGVDVMQEDHPYDLLKEMAAKRVMVEINLTSNDVILNVKGADHPLPMYRLYHVPVALSTDDEGVSRINMTHEYVRAAMTYPLTYSDFKQMVRTGLEHSFLPGDSLWEQTGPWESYARPRAACRSQLGREQASGACAALLEASEKARQQFELERRFQVFEQRLLAISTVRMGLKRRLQRSANCWPLAVALAGTASSALKPIVLTGQRTAAAEPFRSLCRCSSWRCLRVCEDFCKHLNHRSSFGATWPSFHLAHLHCRSSACALFSPASARSATSIRS